MQRSRSLQMTRMTRAHNELKIVWKLKSQYALVAAPCAVIPQSASLLTFTPHNLNSHPSPDVTGRSALEADGQKFSEPSTWVTGRNIEAQSPRHGRTSMANDSEVTLWEDKKTTTSQFRTEDCLGFSIRHTWG